MLETAKVTHLAKKDMEYMLVCGPLSDCDVTKHSCENKLCDNMLISQFVQKVTLKLVRQWKSLIEGLKSQIYPDDDAHEQPL